MTVNQPTGSQRLLSACQAITLKDTFIMVVLFMGAIIMLMPFLWMVTASLHPSEEMYTLPPKFLPTRFNLDAYKQVFAFRFDFLRMYYNSFFVAIMTTFLALLSSCMAGFAFSRINFAASPFVLATILAGMMVPPTLAIIPLFYGMAAIGLLNSIWSLILPAAASPLGIFMMVQFMKSQPREYEEAALIDGANYWTIFYRISLPQLKAPMAALGIIVFTSSWSNFMLPYIFITKEENMTLPVGIMGINAEPFVELSVTMAAVTMSMIPLFIAFLIAQRFFIESLASSGIKG